MRCRRVYDPPAPDDGARFLVDRLWPRGIKKQALRLEAWLPEVAPSHALRRWFGHDPARWDGFVRRYAAELDATPAAWEPVIRAARERRVTLLYGARDPLRNNAVALQRFLLARLKKGG
ncbi:MAG: DUF488 family protein [Gemmatimonadetes bacterium]|nr:DUF488 family protein [Gemmatimonadota bacterium]